MKTVSHSIAAIAMLATGLGGCGSGVVVQAGGAAATLAVAATPPAQSASAGPPATGTQSVPDPQSLPGVRAGTGALSVSGRVCAVPLEAKSTGPCAHCAP